MIDNAPKLAFVARPEKTPAWPACFSAEGVSFRLKIRRHTGFTLVEILVVLAIVSILTSILLLSIAGTKSSRDLANGAYSIQGALEQARTYAMASGTYTWVGFFEENASSPGTAGVGQIVVSIVASANGMNLVTAGSGTTLLPSSSLIQVSKLMKVPNVHLNSVASSAVTRPSIVGTPSTYQVGSANFPNPATSSWSFLYPLTAATSSAAQYTFTQIIQFNPQGDANRIADNPTQYLEVGLQPAYGNAVGAGANYAVIQVTGIGGQVITYRP